MQLTIFALPKPFTQHPLIATIQHNAIASWTYLEPRPEIILMGDDEGVAEAAQKYGARHIPDVDKTKYGIPDVADIFRRANIAAQYSVLAYVNADIILMPSFLKAAKMCVRKFQRFLMIGRRYDMNIQERLAFDEGWADALEERATNPKHGTLHGISGIDYFVHTRGLWSDIPPFSIGRASWDNWLVCAPNKDKHTEVIDATHAVVIVHQNHNIGIKGTPYTFHMKGDKVHSAVLENRRLAGKCKHNVKHAPWVIDKKWKLRKR